MAAPDRPPSLIRQFRVHLLVAILVVVFLGLLTLLQPHTEHALWIAGGLALAIFGLAFWWLERQGRSR